MTIPDAPSLPAITADQMREIDRVMVEDLGIDLARMMENAGRSLAEIAVALYAPERVSVLAGTGGNGGGGLVAARHLANRGREVSVTVTSPNRLTGVPRQQLTILQRMGVAVVPSLRPADLIIDALIGYSLTGNPRGRAADLIRASAGEAPVLALDTPSGLDVTTGMVRSPCVRASATMTLALPKIGLLASGEVGDLYLADISVPPAAYRAIGLDVPAVFRDATILHIRPASSAPPAP